MVSWVWDLLLKLKSLAKINGHLPRCYILKTAQNVSVLIFLYSNTLGLNIKMNISVLITRHHLHRLHMVMAVNEVSRQWNDKFPCFRSEKCPFPWQRCKIHSSIFLVTLFLTIKDFLMQLVEMYIYKSFYLACFCGLFYSKARVRIHATESFCLEPVDPFLGWRTPVMRGGGSP